MKKTLYNQLKDKYSAYNLEYEELCNDYDSNLDEKYTLAGKCDTLYDILMLKDVKITASVIKYLKNSLQLCNSEYDKSLKHYGEAPKYKYLNHPMYYKGCIEIYEYVLRNVSCQRNKIRMFAYEVYQCI
ncbi:MAG: hypothetical protein Q4D26_11470 [Clostridia bacterium]|nr:hypothetical protein [Clostridia bacterium]